MWSRLRWLVAAVVFVVFAVVVFRATLQSFSNQSTEANPAWVTLAGIVGVVIVVRLIAWARTRRKH